MKSVTITELRSNIYQLLDEVINSGVPLEIVRGERKLRISPVEPVDKFAGMEFRQDVINGDPDELVHLVWEYDIDLP